MSKNENLFALIERMIRIFNQFIKKLNKAMNSNKNTIKISKTNEGASYNVNVNFTIPLKEEEINGSLANIEMDLTDLREQGYHQNEKIVLSRREKVALKMKLKNVPAINVDSQLYDQEIVQDEKGDAQKKLIKATEIEKLQVVMRKKQQERKQRERTRDAKYIQKKIDFPKPTLKLQIVSRDVRARSQGNKMGFSSMYFYTNCNYVWNSNAHYLKIPSGYFTVTNSTECPRRKVSYIKFRVDQSNVNVGITTDKKDFIKYTQSKTKYMSYNFGTNSMTICGSIYHSRAMSSLKRQFYCLVDLLNKEFYILNERLQIVRRQNIPENLMGESLYFTIQLREHGRIQFL